MKSWPILYFTIFKSVLSYGQTFDDGTKLETDSI